MPNAQIRKNDEIQMTKLRAPSVPHSTNTIPFAARDFWPSRGARCFRTGTRATLQGSVRSEQRCLGQKEPAPGGLRRFSVLASLLLGYSPTSGDAPSSRLARTENRRNKRGRIYETGYKASALRHSGFGFPSSFQFRHSDFASDLF